MKNIYLFILFFLVYALNNAAYPSDICASLLKSSEQPIQIENDGKIVPSVDLGDLEADQHVKHPAHIGIFIAKNYSSNVQGYCSRSCLTLKTKASPCRGWRYFDGTIQVEPVLTGPNKFSEDFDISVAQPGGDYDGMTAAVTFSVSGRFHGGWFKVSADDTQVSEWLSGKTKFLAIILKNIGDRNLHIYNMYAVAPSIAGSLDISTRLENNSCIGVVLISGQICTFSIYSDTDKIGNSTNALYSISLESNAIGSGTQIYIEHGAHTKPRIGVRAGYSLGQDPALPK